MEKDLYSKRIQKISKIETGEKGYLNMETKGYSTSQAESIMPLASKVKTI